MIKPSTKIKKGTKYIVIETGDEVTFDNVTFEGLHLVNYPNGNWHAFNPDELKPATKQRTPISNKPKQLTTSEISDSKAMNNFFDSLDCPIYCDECKAPLIAYTKFGKRSCSAHLLPKSNFESIKTDRLNIMFLGAGFLGGCHCHDQYDASISSRMKMKIYPNVLRNFNYFKHKLTNQEYIDAHEYLGIPVTTDILKQLK